MAHYVYILSTYGEYGAEEVMATLDRDRVMALVDQGWPDMDARCRAEVKAGLEQMLRYDDVLLSERRDGYACQDGWGGVQLHVVTLW